MRSEFDELKRFAIADILSVSGRQKTTETVDMHINTIIDIAFLKGQQESQSKVGELQKQRDSFIKAYEIEIDESVELQKRVDTQTKHIEMALIAVKDIHKSAIDEFHDWDVLNEKEPKLCEHLQNLSVAIGELEQALNGGGE